MPAIRPAAVAGLFYPEEPELLRAVVEDLLAEVPAGSPAEPRGTWPKAIIAPHAGYVYSGPVAARAYATLRPGRGTIRRAVLVGPSHCVGFAGVAAPRATEFETPLGALRIDLAARDAIADLPQVRIDDGPHAEEHSLEVQLPFLQLVLGEVAILPLVVGEAGPASVAAVLERVWDGRETVVIVSSDLSHFHPDDEARAIDARTAEWIEAYEPARIGPEEACGCRPIGGLLETARARDLAIRRLDLRTSGQTSGSRRRVVGYGAWALSEPAAQPS
ncbi:MAG TPA: AmmeMemoRadiSam system protein B [Kiloniellales bacterium]|nr:AmmeMemoRadiSam system protein B [Kiloniellales bacterium]